MWEQRTLEAVLAQAVGALDGTAAGALAQAVDVLEGLSGHLPVALAGVRRLVLGDGAEDRLPDVAEQAGDVEADAGQGDGERGEQARGEARRVEVDPAGHGGHREAREHRGGNGGGHFGDGFDVSSGRIVGRARQGTSRPRSRDQDK